MSKKKTKKKAKTYSEKAYLAYGTREYMSGFTAGKEGGKQDLQASLRALLGAASVPERDESF